MPLSDSGNKVCHLRNRNPNDGNTLSAAKYHSTSGNIMVSNMVPHSTRTSSTFRSTRKRNTDRHHPMSASAVVAVATSASVPSSSISVGGDRNGTRVPWDKEESLQKLLRVRNLYESAAQSELRRSVLIELEAFLQDWVDHISTTTSSTDVITGRTHTVHICTFGSYRLGVHNARSDIDVLCLTPTHVTRQDFFTSLVQRLQQQYPVITDLQPVPTAFTPVIKMRWKDIAVDLVFANYSDIPPPITDSNVTAPTNSTTTADDAILHRTTSVTQLTNNGRYEFQIQDHHLIGLDVPSIRSLNGVRVVQMMLNLIPPEKLHDFRIVLRTVKEWATVHGIYSNVLGFLGGVNWAIMVVKILQMYPNESSAQLLHKFFITFSRWRWPKPVFIAPTIYSPPPGVTPQVVWNPTVYPRDRTHLMPIITPAYPSMNSSYNVGLPQLRRIRDELYCAATIVGKIINTSEINAHSSTTTTTWDQLMEENNFFHSHIHYVQVNIVANNSKDFRSWFGFCEARLRIFIAGLESPENGVQAYPFARFFSRKVPLSPQEANSSSSSDGAVLPERGVRSPSTTLVCSNEPKAAGEQQQHVSSFFVALRFAPNIECFDLTGSAQEMLFKLNSWEDRVEGMDMTIEHLTQSQLPAFVFEKTVLARNDIDFNNGVESTSNGAGGATRRQGAVDDSTTVNGDGSSSSTLSRAELGKRRNTSTS